MFRDLYKEANDNIKGDRAILDRAFLQAAQPEKKKSPVFKYSFVGTAVAAVMVIGAVFANPTVFTNKSETIGVDESSTPTENATVFKATEDSVTAENNEIAIVSSIEDETPINTADTTKVTTSKPKSGSQKAAEADRAETFENDYNLAVMSLEDEEGAAIEAATEEQVVFKIARPEADVEDIAEEVTESIEEVEVFSYLYDMNCGYDMMTDGFRNTDISPVTSREEAIGRALSECTVEYDGVYVAYDPVEGVWRVTFSCDDEVASEQIVWMNSDGVTLGIVYLA